MKILQVEDLTKRYGSIVAVDAISFDVERGTTLGFLGVNGAGKTTAISMLSTLVRPDAGRVEICGEILGKNDSAIRRKIGIVFQSNYLDDILTVRENLICRGAIHDVPRARLRSRLDELAEILKLGELLDRRYRALSGGQKRRCEIAAALMHSPELLFLDEPTTGLDPATRIDVWETIDALRTNEKTTVFLTTHYMEEAADADKIAILDRGKIVATGTPFELKERFAQDKLRLFRPNGDVEERPLAKTLDAIPILQREKDALDGFEVVQGTMDDVFLNAVAYAQRERSAER